MKLNVGKTDRTIRLLLAAVMAGLGIYFKTWWGFLALIPFITSVAGFCPLYTLFGINTCNVTTKPK